MKTKTRKVGKFPLLKIDIGAEVLLHFQGRTRDNVVFAIDVLNPTLNTMDKLSIISGALFFAADVFAVVSLAMPHWIVSEIGGDTNIGLLKTCLTIYGRPNICFMPSPIRGEWLLTFICIVLGIICISVTIVLLALSYWEYRVMKFARWLGFVAMILFCLAAVIFPIGFDMDQIGGEAYQLPNNYRVGISYIFFVLALWITVVSQLFASKVCLPHF